MILNLRKPGNVIDRVTLCDVDSSGLCIVNFGTDILGNMIINFQLPDADYPLFYVKAANRGIVNTYPCKASSNATNIFCSGARTPLGEYLDVEVYSAAEDTLMAQGRFIVSALIRTTPDSLIDEQTPTAELTPIPGTAYPNP
ncbi:MAG: hypothetical protein HY864_14395 [Chloroflexi bacterium]|nr:hypothetical protein [Chloroflexota bacterium]